MKKVESLPKMPENPKFVEPVYENSNVIVLDADDFRNDDWFVEFYAPWWYVVSLNL